MPTTLQIATVAGAVVWPLGAGLALVLWSKARAAAHARKVAAMEADLRGMFHDIESSPVPNRLTMVVDALEEGEALTPARAAARDSKSTVRS
ncbi:hypothetical protein [Phenylobacterium deserti]|uniref:Uncharacterized protein n=1 Tax=Phenylobacterium deserti TaxID=1914756 RepID=A0A328ARE0_9CAUL|nr:hypothetical protein [Phenylobacterium deserti]RAK56811.1 hypothetical protein DJ018_02215 [Phenylobacterium deserti]